LTPPIAELVDEFINDGLKRCPREIIF